MSSVLILVPAKGTSRGVPRKNLADLCGKPLVWWTIEQANAAKVGEIVVSTDDHEIRQVAWECGANVLVRDRPKELATDEASTESVMLDILQDVTVDSSVYLQKLDRPDILVVLQPTSPLRLAEHIQWAVNIISSPQCNSVSSVTRFHGCVWEANREYGVIDPVGGSSCTYHIGHPKWQGSETKQRKRRQEMTPEFIENGSIYAVRVPKFLEEKTRFCGHTFLYEMPWWTRWEVDAPEELGLIRTILRQRMEQGGDGINS